MPLASFSSERRLTVFAGDQTRIDRDASTLNDVVVIAAAESHPAVLENDEPSPLRPVLRKELFEPHHAVRDALHLQVVVVAGQVVEEQHGAASAAKKLLERENLPAVPQRAACEQPKLRE